MRIKIITALLPLLIISSCAKEDTSGNDHMDPETFVNDLKVTITGVRGGSYHITGKDVGVGCLGFSGNRLAYFSVGFVNDQINFSTGMFSPDVTAVKEQVGANGLAEYGSGDDWKNKFSSMQYWMFYETEDPHYKEYTWLTISRFENRVEEQPVKVTHIRLTGTFHFKASNMPSDISEAALLDAWNRGLNGTPIPLYLPELAGTSKIEASGSFDVLFSTFGY